MTRNEAMQFLEIGDYSSIIKALYTYYPVVKKYILKNGGEIGDIEDIFQEGILITYRKIKSPDFQLTASLQTYLFSVCKNLWSEHIRKKKTTTVLDVNVLEDKVSEEDSTSDQISSKLHELIKNLGNPCKEILTRFYFYKEKMGVICKKMNYGSVNSAKTQKYKCLERLRNTAYPSLVHLKNS